MGAERRINVATKAIPGISDGEMAQIGVEALVAALLAKGTLTQSDIDTAFTNAVAASNTSLKRHATRHNRT
jgi:hypothetical protein